MNKKILLVAALLLTAGVAMAMGGFGGNSSQLALNMINIVSKAFGKKLKPRQEESIQGIAAAWAKYGDGDIRKLVYILAIAWHESRLEPIKEIKAAPGTPIWDKYQYKYWPSGYYGRGFVQLTLKGNYENMGKFLGVDLVNNPDLALNPKYAAEIIVFGMMNGKFSGKGKKLGDFINKNEADYYNARVTVGSIMVNNIDTAKLIEGHTRKILAQMEAEQNA